jgi:hypothetical protein
MKAAARTGKRQRKRHISYKVRYLKDEIAESDADCLVA